jgi:outer membrane autotransporter protein
LVGADYRWSRSLKTGLFAGYQAVDARYSGSGHLRVNGAAFGGYATFDPGNGFYANLIARGAVDGYTAKRPIQFGSIDRVAHSDFDSGDGGVFLEGGYDFKLKDWTIGPVANAQFTYFKVASFTEDNAQSLDLRVGGQEVNSFQTNLGGRVAYTWGSPGRLQIIPECRIFWNTF